jgi:hypothetical protein
MGPFLCTKANVVGFGGIEAAVIEAQGEPVARGGAVDFRALSRVAATVKDLVVATHGFVVQSETGLNGRGVAQASAIERFDASGEGGRIGYQLKGSLENRAAERCLAAAEGGIRTLRGA